MPFAPMFCKEWTILTADLCNDHIYGP